MNLVQLLRQAGDGEHHSFEKEEERRKRGRNRRPRPLAFGKRAPTWPTSRLLFEPADTTKCALNEPLT